MHAVELVNINKSFPGVQALKNVTFRLREGEVKALIGENGAGKSTLIKILTGAYTPDNGEIYVFGKRIDRMTPIVSESLGISAVYQNLILAPHLTVAENILLGNEPRRFGFIDKKEMMKRAKEALKKVGYEGIIDPKEKLSNLTVAHQGIVAIARAISRNARIVIFDEPTAVLAKRETEELFRIIKELKQSGVSVIYISHRLEEIFEICDTVYVLKDGEFVGEKEVSETSIDELISMMVGRKVKKDVYMPGRKIGRVVLRVENIVNDRLRGCSLELREGEIVGLYGLVGSGRTELARAIFGADPVESGRIEVEGKPILFKSPAKAISNGVALLPEDRRVQGLALKLSVKHNINLPIYRHISKLGFLSLSKERENAKRFVERLRIKTPSINQVVMNLSGGNQQKVVISKWLASRSKVFIMDEPTNGIDVGAKEEIYALMNELASQGAAILFISSYMPELMAICDRILVMRGGRIVGNIMREEFDEERILSLAIKENGEVTADVG